MERQARIGLTSGTSAALLAFVAPAAALAQSDCSAEEWPCQTIEVVSHASPGGGTDTTIRMWLDAANEITDEEWRVVYKQGGGSRAAHEYALNRGADGHTIIALTQTHLYTIARGNSPLSIDGIQGVARAMDDPSVIVVRPDAEYEGYEDFVSQAQGGDMTWGVAQVGGTEHIGISRWGETAGVEARVVPFGSGGDMITSLRSGAVDATLANVSEALQLIEEGELKPIAVLYDERVDDLPEVPTSGEFGHEASVTTTRGYYVLDETPQEIVDRMEEVILEAMQSERFQDYLTTAGLNPETNIAGSETWDSQLKEEYQVSLEALRELDMTDQ